MTRPAFLRRLTSSQRVLLMPVVAAVAFLLLLLLNWSGSRRSERLGIRMRDGYVPALELAVRLTQSFTRLQRTLQDAVAGSDIDHLLEGDAVKEEMVRQLEAGRRNPVLSAPELKALQADVESYYELARSTSLAMIGPAPGRDLTPSLERMTKGYNELKTRLDAFSTRQNAETNEAFASTETAQRRSAELFGGVILVCLVLLVGLSAVIGRSQEEAARAHRESEERYRQLFELNPQPMWVYDRETLGFLEVNEAAIVHYGYSREEFLGRMTLRDIRPERDIPQLLEDIASPLAVGSAPHVRKHRTKDGRLLDVEVAWHVISYYGATAQLALLTDVTEKRKAEELLLKSQKMLEYSAYHDGLTALPNRSLFSELLSQSIGQARRHNRQLAVMFLDLDRFKYINDTLGHEAGDQLLQEVATRLKACLRDSDTVARLGGDEFVVLLPELPEEKDVTAVAWKILSGISKPFVLLGQEFRVTTSIGISTYPGDGLDEQTLMKNADTAMYRAKEEGKNQFQFYSENLNIQSLERLALESSLRFALERNEFELHYQAKRDMRSGQITGMEALLRWRHPDLGTVAPMRFIPLAEETGLIVPIGKWVLRTACLQNVAWQRQGLPRLRMAVNLAARQFSDEALLPDLVSILETTGMDASLLELGINERLLMHDVERALRILTALKDIGVKVAIDDFGIGYASLSTLKRFPFDTIKIDRSFIRDVASVAEDKAFTEAIIAMGRTLSLTVVAQGVETRAQVDFLREHACDEFQGFYYNRPVPAEQFAKLLQSQTDISDSGTHVTDAP